MYVLFVDEEYFAIADGENQLKRYMDNAVKAGFSIDQLQVYAEIRFTYTPAVSTLVI